MLTINMIISAGFSKQLSTLIISFLLLLLLHCQFATSSLYLGHIAPSELLNTTDEFSWKMAPGEYRICMTPDWNKPQNKPFKTKVYLMMQFVSLQFLVATQRVWFVVVWNGQSKKNCDILLIPQRELNQQEKLLFEWFEKFFGVPVNGIATFPDQYASTGQGFIKLRPTAFENGTSELLYRTLQHELGHIHGLRHSHGWEANRFNYSEPPVYRFGKFDPCTIMGYDIIQGCLKMTEIDVELLGKLYKNDCKLRVLHWLGDTILLPQVIVSRDGFRLSNETCVNDGS